MQGRFRDIWRNLDTRGQVTLIGALVAVLVVGFVLFRVASRPSYAALATGLDPADASEVAGALDAAGVGYRLVNGGTEVDVVQGQESRARVALADEGLPRGGHVGFEIFDKQSLGTTDFQQRVNYQRALEGEIGRTIEEIDGVRGAQVQLVLPQESLFLDEGSKASAAVLLEGASMLDGGTVKGIAHLVSSSVEGLDPEKVTITDGEGSMLWPDADASFGSSSRLESEQQYAAQLSALANAMLTNALGEGKADARVHAALNVDQTTRDTVRYDDEGTPLTTQTEQETLQSEGSTSGTAAGTASNIPGYAATENGSGGSNEYNKKSTHTDFGVDKTVERTVVAPGAVERLDVALLFDQSVPADQVVDLRNAVGALVGLDAERGDTISTATLEFAAPAEEEAAKAGGATGALANPLGLVKYVVLGVGSLLFLFLMRRGLRRRESEAIAPEPTWLRQIEGAVPIAQLNPAAPMPRELDPRVAHREAVKSEVEEIAKREPEKVAAQVGQWLRQ
jgi:flagellar M-ring protein FliF